MTKKEIKKQKIKIIIKKIIDILCYIGTFLLILILVVVGIQSCEKKPQSVSAETETRLILPKKLTSYNELVDQYSFSYRQKQTDQFDMDIAFNVSLSNYFSIPIGIVSDPVGTSINKILYSSTPYLVYKFGEGEYELNNMQFIFQVEANAQSNKLYRLTSVYGSSTDGSYTSLVVKTSSSADSFHYAYNGGYQMLFKNEPDFVINEVFSYFYEKNDISTFVFNKEFNYNAPLGTNLNGLYGDAVFDSSGQNMRYKNYNVGYFISNGMIFNQIKYWAIQSDGNTVYGTLSTGGSGLISAPTGHWIYSYIYYVNTDSNTEVLVNYHNTQPYSTSGGGTSLYYANSSTWINDQFRYITFLSSLSDSMTISINAFNNNNQNTYSGYVGSGDVTDVFTLVASAFTAWIPIMDLTILPGITLGILVFIPLVAMLVFAIIRIIKK